MIRRSAFLFLALGCTALACRELVMPEAWTDPAQAGADFAIQGEYAAPGAPVGAQVIARGDGDFTTVLLGGGLPGAGFDGHTRAAFQSRREGATLVFGSEREGEARARLTAGRLRGTSADGRSFDLQRVERSSPTLGEAPPPGAVVVFGGPGSPGAANATSGEVNPQGDLLAGATSHYAFGDALLHIEFRTPFEPSGRGQMRGNSGVYLQNRYEIQVLDSFGLAGEDNECGAIYEQRGPALNMAFPPLAWQTYDIGFRAARFDANGARSEAARVTVRHNGVVVHDDVALLGPTGAGDAETPEPGPLYLQYHWNPVVYRNVWILPRGDRQAVPRGAAGGR